MLRLDWSEKFDRWLNVISGASPIIVAIVGAILKIEDGYFKSPIFLGIISAIRNRAWWIILTFSVIGILAQVIRARIGTPVIWQRFNICLISIERNCLKEEVVGSMTHDFSIESPYSSTSNGTGDLFDGLGQAG